MFAYQSPTSLLSEIPAGADDKQFLFLGDIFPTAWAGLDLARFQPSDTVVIFGAGPVGLLTAYSAFIRGANKVYVVDRVEDRLFLAAAIGAIPIDFTRGDPATQILAKEPNGVQRVVDCVGEEAVNGNGQPEEGYVLSQAIRMTSFHGGIGIVGIYNAENRTAGTPLGASIPPTVTFPMTPFWAKGLTIGSGIVDALAYQPTLFPLLSSGRAQPGFIVSSVMNLEDAPEAYDRFDQKLESKILLSFPPNSGGSKKRSDPPPCQPDGRDREGPRRPCFRQSLAIANPNHGTAAHLILLGPTLALED